MCLNGGQLTREISTKGLQHQTKKWLMQISEQSNSRMCRHCQYIFKMKSNNVFVLPIEVYFKNISRLTKNISSLTKIFSVASAMLLEMCWEWRERGSWVAVSCISVNVVSCSQYTSDRLYTASEYLNMKHCFWAINKMFHGL